MPNTRPLALAQQLWLAIESLPHPATCADTIRMERTVNLRQIEDRISPDGTVKLAERIPVEFEKVAWEGPAGKVAAWRYHGPARIDAADIDFAGGMAKLPEWIKAGLGSRCAAVTVLEHRVNVAMVNIVLHWSREAEGRSH